MGACDVPRGLCLRAPRPTRRRPVPRRRGRLRSVVALASAALWAANTPGTVLAQQTRPPQDTAQSQVNPNAHPEQSAGDWLGVPLVFYSPETLLAGGVVGIYYFRVPGSERDTRPSNIKGDVIYTMREQFLAQVSPQLYFDNEKYFLDTELSFVRYFDRYWGIGNQTPESNREEYTSDTFRGRVGLLRRLPPYMNFGPRLHFEDVRLRTFAPGGLIDTDESLVGSRQSSSSGYGIEAQFDSRDNYFSATRGAFVSAQAMVFTRTLGGNVTYLLYRFDARTFLRTFPGHVLALQGYFNSVTPGAPFTALSSLGGINRMRGLFEGRFRDRLAAIVQVEYRMPIYWRFSGVAFAAAGQVAPRLDAFDLRDIHLTGGGGVRFTLKEEERISLRFDVGFSVQGPAFYISANEAF